MFGHILGIQYECTERLEQFTSYAGPRINYSELPFNDCISVFPSGLLSSTAVSDLLPEIENAVSFPILFPTKREGFFPFDLFAASFYLLSRYEEYLPYKADRHGRFEAGESLAHRNGFLNRPLVNEWSFFLLEEIKRRWPALNYKLPDFHFQPTIDIDTAWAFRNKGNIRCLAAATRDLLSGKIKQFVLRKQVITGKAADPFDNYSWINGLHQAAGLRPVWFFLSGSWGPHDPNSPIDHPAMKLLVRECMQQGEIGIHPSYGSHLRPKVIGKELKNLSLVTGTDMHKSRQHFLRLNLPETYRHLVQLGIRDDYSMGYASQPGFRAGTSTPFRFYDLLADEETPLTIHPFQVMERTFTDYLGIKPEAALLQMLSLAELVKKYRGEFVSIFHNETLGIELGWREPYEKLVMTIKNW
ncbi:MAG: polysaccharide deacetylase family protein [Bacteroidales bacterium]